MVMIGYIFTINRRIRNRMRIRPATTRKTKSGGIKMRKRILAVALSLAMALGMTACGNGGSDSASSDGKVSRYVSKPEASFTMQTPSRTL